MNLDSQSSPADPDAVYEPCQYGSSYMVENTPCSAYGTYPANPLEQVSPGLLYPLDPIAPDDNYNAQKIPENFPDAMSNGCLPIASSHSLDVVSEVFCCARVVTTCQDFRLQQAASPGAPVACASHTVADVVGKAVAAVNHSEMPAPVACSGLSSLQLAGPACLTSVYCTSPLRDPLATEHISHHDVNVAQTSFQTVSTDSYCKTNEDLPSFYEPSPIYINEHSDQSKFTDCFGCNVMIKQ